MSDAPSTLEIEVLERTLSRVGALDVTEWRVHIPPTLRYFQGHFEDHPVLPAVAQIQCIVLRLTREAWPDLLMLRRCTRLKFRRVLLPGDLVRVRIERPVGAPRVTFSIEKNGETTGLGALEFAPGGER